jgi:NitT/TauT family transport system substrate-binding protein
MAALPRSARADMKAMRFGNAAGVNDPQISFITVGNHPKLGYYRDEGIEAHVVNMSSSSQSLQALATDDVEFATLSPATYLPIIAKNPSLNIISVYTWLRQMHYSVGVKPDSPFKTIADLKGQKIGIRNQGDGGYFALQAMFQELGIDPQRDVEWISVGTGGPAGAALYNGSIDAIAIWDAELARVEIASFKLRYIPNTPLMQKMFGSSFGVSRTALKHRRAEIVGLFRGMAKSTIFAHTNPTLAIRIHWALFPESKPKGKSDAEALKDALHILEVRKDKWFAAPWQADKRMGASSLAEWQEQVRFAGLQDPTVPDKIKDVAALFTNELIDEVNNFDRSAVERQARELVF